MRPDNNSDAPYSASEGLTVSNTDKTCPFPYWIRWKDSGNYYFQGNSMMEFIRIRKNLIGFPKLTKHFEYSHELTTKI